MKFGLSLWRFVLERSVERHEHLALNFMFRSSYIAL